MNFFVFLQKLENKLEPVPRRNDNLKCDYFLVLSTVLTKNRFRVFDFLKMMISEDLCKDNHQLLLVRRDFLVISEDLCKDNRQLLLVRRAGRPPDAPRPALGETKKL